MQYHVEVRCRVSMSRLMEDALIHYPCTAQHEQDGTHEQPPTADHRTHPLVETDGEDDEQQTGDNKIGIQNPAARSYSQVANYMIDRRVAWTQEASQGEYQYTEYRADYSYKRYESRWDAPFPPPMGRS